LGSRVFSAERHSRSPGRVAGKLTASADAGLKIFHRKLTVKPVAGTRLIDVEYLSPDPQLAAAVVNHLLEGLIEKGFQARYDATMQASSWLSAQLGDLRAKTQELQAKVVKLQQESGVFAVGEVDREGRDQVYNPTLEKLQMATQAEAQAQSNRILKGAINDVVKSGNAELISGLAGNAAGGVVLPPLSAVRSV
jgi:succinoglycan biosynthesis transport protein ExoP